MRRAVKRAAIRVLGPQGFERLKTYADAWIDSYRGTTYSQFGEDVILRQIFRRRSAGYYVDVGRVHPMQYSNTYWFYRRGWHGINVDANQDTIALFDKVRPRDCNVAAAVSDSADEIVFNSWGVNPGNTVSPAQALAMEQDFGPPRQRITLRAVPLARVLEEKLPAGQAIDLLNVDVEGHDLEVLRSNDWQRYHPTVVVAEHFVHSIEDVLASELYCYLLEQHYKLACWLQPGLIFVDQAAYHELMG